MHTCLCVYVLRVYTYTSSWCILAEYFSSFDMYPWFSCVLSIAITITIDCYHYYHCYYFLHFFAKRVLRIILCSQGILYRWTRGAFHIASSHKRDGKNALKMALKKTKKHDRYHTRTLHRGDLFLLYCCYLVLLLLFATQL